MAEDTKTTTPTTTPTPPSTPTDEAPVVTQNEQSPLQAMQNPVATPEINAQPEKESKEESPKKDAAPAIPTTVDTPVVVSEDEVASVSDNSEALHSEIENLTGEVQALEAKIDRLTTDESPEETKANPVVAPVAAENSALKTDEPPIAALTPDAPKTEEKPVESPKPEPTISMPKSETPATPSPSPTTSENAKSGSALNDIYARLDAKPTEDAKKPASPDKSENLGDLTQEQGGSTIALVSEIIAVVGILVFLVMMVTPFLTTLFPESVLSMLKSVGWLSSVAIIAVATILSLFAKGRTSLKVMLILFLLIAVFMFLGATNSSLLTPLDSFLGSFFGFYR